MLDRTARALTAARRFYAPDASGIDRTVALPPGEARQLGRVLRLRRGAAVQVFDGRGREFAARVQSVDRDGVSVRTLAAVEPAREPAVRLELALALLKGRASGAVVRDATMLGVAAIQPVVTARSLALPAAAGPNGLADRWRAIAISSAKQCRRAVVPEVRPVAPFSQLVAHPSPGLGVLLVEPVLGVPRAGIRALAERPAPDRATIAAGPEGGWTDAEVDAAAAAGFEPLTLGSRTLRADAAPAAAIVVLQHVWDDL